MTIEKIWITNTAVWFLTADGCEACEKLEDYPHLKFATQAQRENFMSDRFGIHWEGLDEDLSFEGFFRHKNNNPLYDLFMSHPEVNASAIARGWEWHRVFLQNISVELRIHPKRELR